MDTGSAQSPARPRFSLIRRFFIAMLMAVVGVNIWTGNPLLALWVGSRVQGEGPPKMTAVFVVIGMLIGVGLLLARVLAGLGSAYDRASGRVQRGPHRASWLKSMRAERDIYPGERVPLSGLERTLIVVVVLAVAAFEIWFFFFSGSPIGHA